MNFRKTRLLEEACLTWTVEPDQNWNFLLGLKVGLENVDTKYVQNLKDTFKLLRKNTSYEFFPGIQSNVVSVIAF